jgi:MFS family permease
LESFSYNLAVFIILHSGEILKNNKNAVHQILNITVIVSALGYFVDMYDLLLFAIVRIPSLKALGYSGQALTENGVLLLNMQMVGMLIGGIVWGIMGDKRGRLNVLFGSILLYSIANIANAFVTDITQYSIARFFAGVGLAGELGAAITLVSEVLPQELRGYGTAIVASVGIAGAVAAALVGDFLHWQVSYIVGGLLGIILLILRLKMFEPVLFLNLKTSTVRKGDFLSLFTSRKRFFKYIKCILIGLPFWYVVGILMTFSPEFGKVLNIQEPVVAGQAIMFNYIGAVFGDILSGFGSQYIKSRKKTILIFISFGAVFVFIYLFLSYNLPLFWFYAICMSIGFSFGYWAVFVTIGAEQFGTNLRSTVATTVPNFVRGLTVLITSSFLYLNKHVPIIQSAIIVGVIVFAIAFIALWRLEESYHKNLDYVED